MKYEKASDKIKELVKHFENRKAYISGGTKIKSKIVAHSRHGIPAYFIRADYEIGKEAKKTPIAYWQINNPFTPYLEEKRQKIENLKDLIKTEKRLDLPSDNSKYEYKQEKERYEFMTQIRQVAETEINERIQEDRLVFIK